RHGAAGVARAERPEHAPPGRDPGSDPRLLHLRVGVGPPGGVEPAAEGVEDQGLLVADDGASYCPSDNLLINQADFAADREMTGVETCGFWRPAECLHVRYLSPEQ